MSQEPLLLGLDVGTTGIKALLVDRSGNRQGFATAPTPFSHGPEGVQMSAEALRDGARQVLSALGRDRRRVAGIGLAGMAESGTALDADGRPLGPILAWHDRRGQDTVSRLTERFGQDLATRIGQPLRAVSSVAKLGWLCAQGADGLHRWLGVPELCLFWLSGTAATEYSLAARTGCYDVTARRYLPEVAEAAGIDPDVFPPVRAAGEPMGRVSAAGSVWSGLPAGIPVTVAGHDHLAGAAGVGAGHDDLVNSVGTAETVLRTTPDPPDVDRALELELAVTVCPGGLGWAVLASAARAGMVLEAAAEALGRSIRSLDELAEGAGHADVGDLLDRLLQQDSPRLPAGAPGEIWNGLLAALSEETAAAAQRLVELLGPAGRLVIIGGGGASPPWLRAKARAATLRVFRSTETQAAARGAALFSGMAAGWWPRLDRAPAAAIERVS